MMNIIYIYIYFFLFLLCYYAIHFFFFHICFLFFDVLMKKAYVYLNIFFILRMLLLSFTFDVKAGDKGTPWYLVSITFKKCWIIYMICFVTFTLLIYCIYIYFCFFLIYVFCFVDVLMKKAYVYFNIFFYYVSYF